MRAQFKQNMKLGTPSLVHKDSTIYIVCSREYPGSLGSKDGVVTTVMMGHNVVDGRKMGGPE